MVIDLEALAYALGSRISFHGGIEDGYICSLDYAMVKDDIDAVTMTSADGIGMTREIAADDLVHRRRGNVVFNEDTNGDRRYLRVPNALIVGDIDKE